MIIHDCNKSRKRLLCFIRLQTFEYFLTTLFIPIMELVLSLLYTWHPSKCRHPMCIHPTMHLFYLSIYLSVHQQRKWKPRYASYPTGGESGATDRCEISHAGLRKQHAHGSLWPICHNRRAGEVKTITQKWHHIKQNGQRHVQTVQKRLDWLKMKNCFNFVRYLNSVGIWPEWVENILP